MSNRAHSECILLVACLFAASAFFMIIGFSSERMRWGLWVGLGLFIVAVSLSMHLFSFCCKPQQQEQQPIVTAPIPPVPILIESNFI